MFAKERPALNDMKRKNAEDEGRGRKECAGRLAPCRQRLCGVVQGWDCVYVGTVYDYFPAVFNVVDVELNRGALRRRKTRARLRSHSSS